MGVDDDMAKAGVVSRTWACGAMVQWLQAVGCEGSWAGRARERLMSQC